MPRRVVRACGGVNLYAFHTFAGMAAGGAPSLQRNPGGGRTPCARRPTGSRGRRNAAVVAVDWICYKEAMNVTLILSTSEVDCPRRHAAVARLAEPGSILLHDHTRLPGRFFGRMTASVQAELSR